MSYMQLFVKFYLQVGLNDFISTWDKVEPYIDFFFNTITSIRNRVISNNATMISMIFMYSIYLTWTSQNQTGKVVI